MPVTRIRMRVEMDTGDTWEVDTDQRDQARYELQDFYQPNRFLIKQRFMAYVASCRQDKTKLSWAKFDAACVEVIGVDAEGVESLDPTQPVPSGIPSST